MSSVVFKEQPRMSFVVFEVFFDQAVRGQKAQSDQDCTLDGIMDFELPESSENEDLDKSIEELKQIFHQLQCT